MIETIFVVGGLLLLLVLFTTAVLIAFKTLIEMIVALFKNYFEN